MTTEKKPRKPRSKKLEQPIQTHDLQTSRITLDTILDENKKYEELQIVILDGVGYTEIYRYFSPVKIENLLESFSKFIEDYKSTVEVVKENKFWNFLNVFIIFHFSKLVDKIPETHEEKADIVNKVLNSVIAETVAESFDKNEVAKIHERLQKKSEAILELYKANVDAREQIIDHVKNSKFENKEIILSAMFGIEKEPVEEEIEMSEEIGEH